MSQIQVYPIHVILGEINNVMAAMRLNSRWSSRTRVLNINNVDNPLLKGFKTLRTVLESTTDIRTLDTLMYVKPFLNIIRSEETSGPITGVALSSINKFLSGFISLDSINASKAIDAIVEAVTHCRFEATDPESDEVVLMKILQVLLACIRSPIGVLLSDDLVFELIQTCYRMSSQLRLSELLRKTAEHSLIEVIQTIFSQFGIYSYLLFEENSAIPKGQQTPSNVESQSDGLKVNPQGVHFEKGTEEDTSLHNGHTTKTFGLPCLVRVFQFVCSVIKPPPPQRDTSESEHIEEDICLLGLTLVSTIIEKSTRAILQFPQMMNIVQDDLTKNLMRCCSSDNLAIITLSLRIFFHIFIHMREHLKAQMELFFNSLIRISDNKQQPINYEKQETILEVLLHFCKEPNFIVSLMINYDCDYRCSNVVENLAKFLYKSACPVNNSIYTIHLLALDALGSIVESISDRLQLTNSTEEEKVKALEVQQQMKLKSIIMTAVEQFNVNPEAGFKHLQASNYLPPVEAEDYCDRVAFFLRHAHGLNKTVVGEFLGKSKPLNCRILESYIQTFSFQLDEKFIFSLRSLMESFRIPGEAQIIARLLEYFARIYTGLVPDAFVNADAAYILSYSVVLLNVDQHKPEVKNKMTEYEFIRNNRGINGGKDLPPDMLKEIYQNIKHNEMKIPEEHSHEVTDSMWKHVISKNRSSDDKIVTVTRTEEAHLYDETLFTIVWNPFIAAVSSVFESAQDEALLKKSTEAYHWCAKIAAHYGLNDAIDNLIMSLCKFSTLLTPSISQPGGIGVGPLTLYGSNAKAQLTTKLAFSLSKKYSDNLREGWKNILQCVLNVNKMGLLPPFMDKSELIDVNDNSAAKGTTPRSQARSSSSIFGMLGASSWFGFVGSSQTGTSSSYSATSSYSYSGGSESGPTSPHDLSQDDILLERDPQEEKKAQDTIKECAIPELFLESSKFVEIDGLAALVRTLISMSTRPTHHSNSNSQNNANSASASPVVRPMNAFQWDEKSSMFLLDLLTTISLLNQSRLQPLWNLIAEHLVNIIENSTRMNEFLDKALTNLLYMSIKLVHNKEIRDQVLLSIKCLINMNATLAEALTKKMAYGILRLTEEDPTVIDSEIGWQTIIAFLDFFSCYSSSESYGFRILSGLVSHKSSVNFDNFPSWCSAVFFFTKPKCSSTVTISAMELMYTLFSSVSNIMQLNPEDTQTTDKAWNDCWLPLLQHLCTLCRDHRLDVRNYAMTYLQRSLFSSHLNVLSPSGCFNCFSQVVFPLMNDLLKPPPSSPLSSSGTVVQGHTMRDSGGYYPTSGGHHPNSGSSRMDAAGLEETRLRASALLAKLFLQYLPKLTSLDNFKQLWLQILQFMEMYMKADDSELLAEAVRESLKNILLVMSASDLFHSGSNSNTSPSSNEELSSQLWSMSWEVIDSFCPSLKAEWMTNFPEEFPSAVLPPSDQSNISMPTPTNVESNNPNVQLPGPANNQSDTGEVVINFA